MQRLRNHHMVATGHYGSNPPASASVARGCAECGHSQLCMIFIDDGQHRPGAIMRAAINLANFVKRVFKDVSVLIIGFENAVECERSVTTLGCCAPNTENTKVFAQ